MDDIFALGITFTSCDEVEAICTPFFEATGITYFNFVRIYKDGTRICLSNNQKWMKFVFSNHHKFKIIFEEILSYTHATYLLWDLVPEILTDELMQLAKNDFDIDHGITLISRHEKFTEFYYFGAPRSNSEINHYYINNQDVFKAFALYFKDKGDSLINKAEEERAALLKKPFPNPFVFNKPEIHADKHEIKRRKDFFEVCHIERFYLGGDLKDVYLSRREAECMASLLEGKAPKEISKELGISDRTVEKYVDSVKKKISCTFRKELLNRLKANNFHMIYETIHAMKKEDLN